MINTFNEDKESNFLLICDHASNYIPTEYNGLGLSEAILNTHIAYDIGAKKVALNISKFLKCPLVMTNFSRLLIDANRGVDDPTLIMKISDNNVIEGNKNISFQDNCDEKKKRIIFFYEAYHSKISDIINKAISKKVFPAIVSIHSFTSLWKGKKRSTDLGILWDSDDRLPNIFFNYLNKNYKDMNIGNNIPYSGRMKNDTLYNHGTSKGLANILIEIRQDLILDSKEQLRFSKLITKPLADNINNTSLFRKKFYKSFAK